MRFIKIIISVVCVLVALAVIIFVFTRARHYEFFSSAQKTHLFDVQAIDTMKYSRDMSAQILNNPADYDQMIGKQMDLIKSAGATHVAIGTPYDERFAPVLSEWVKLARTRGLSVWFRGNFSGWEGWFNMPKIDRQTHAQLLVAFIRNHPRLFRNGDVFTPCTECENGGPGDPRQTGDKSGYNRFLVEEYGLARGEFAKEGKSISVFNSMNGDIARQIITPHVAAALGGAIMVDHYVPTVAQFANDIPEMSRIIDANIGLGEFGGPVPDLNGDMTEEQQAGYVAGLLHALYLRRDDTPAVDYWTLKDGSTALVNPDDSPRAAYYVVQAYYRAPSISGHIFNTLGDLIGSAKVFVDDTGYAAQTDGNSFYQVFVVGKSRTITVVRDGYATSTFTLPTNAASSSITHNFYMTPVQSTWWYHIRQELAPYVEIN